MRKYVCRCCGTTFTVRLHPNPNLCADCINPFAEHSRLTSRADSPRPHSPFPTTESRPVMVPVADP